MGLVPIISTQTIVLIKAYVASGEDSDLDYHRDWR